MSPSASAPPEGVQVKVLDAVGELGLMLTLVSVGAVLSTVTVFEVTAVPEEVPSVGVARHTTVWPLEKDVPLSVAVVALTVEPFTRQAYVADTASPSVSEPPAGVQVKVSDSVGDVGLKVALV